MSKRTITLTIDVDTMNRIKRILPLLPAFASDAEDVITPTDYLLYVLEKDLEFNESDMLVNIHTGEVRGQSDVVQEANLAALRETKDEQSRKTIGERMRKFIQEAGWRELADVPLAE